MQNINDLLEIIVEKGASDLHLKTLQKPVFRIDGQLVPYDDEDELPDSSLTRIFQAITTREQQERFYENKELDFHYSISGVARFRVSALQQRGSLSLAFRIIPYKIPSLDELGLPEIYKTLALKPRGLILVTGPTGSGKSTTLAAMVKYLNEHESRVIITIENPIEYLHNDKKCLINQRSVGDDTLSFEKALIHALRHDPDVIILGEMRDLGTISTAITAAETGHLVMGTLHTTDAAQSVDRIIDVFPPIQQQQIRLQMSQVLEAVLSQALVPRLDGGRVAATEIMIVNAAIRNVLREGQSFKIPNIIQTNQKEGMLTLEQSLATLVKQKVISEDDALLKTSKPEQLMNLIANKTSNGFPDKMNKRDSVLNYPR